MSAAVPAEHGHVTSIGLDDDGVVARAVSLLKDARLDDRHTLIRENSNRVLPRLFLSGEKFDFIFLDGWKTVDHVIFEVYLFNQLLELGGTIVFDDAYMPSVRKAISLLVSHYGYEEIDYRHYGHTLRLRLFHVLTRRSLVRPDRGFRKVIPTENQPAFTDWQFYKRI